MSNYINSNVYTVYMATEGDCAYVCGLGWADKSVKHLLRPAEINRLQLKSLKIK